MLSSASSLRSLNYADILPGSPLSASDCRVRSCFCTMPRFKSNCVFHMHGRVQQLRLSSSRCDLLCACLSKAGDQARYTTWPAMLPASTALDSVHAQVAL